MTKTRPQQRPLVDRMTPHDVCKEHTDWQGVPTEPEQKDVGNSVPISQVLASLLSGEGGLQRSWDSKENIIKMEERIKPELYLRNHLEPNFY